MAKKKQPQVYVWRNTVNEKHYVGKAEYGYRNRWSRHLHDMREASPRKFARALRKHGPAAFALVELWQFENNARAIEQMNARERALIRQYGSLTNGYNMTEGGDGSHGHRATPETRAKMSTAQRRAWREGRRKAVRGWHHPPDSKVFSEEHRQSQAEIAKQQPRRPKPHCSVSGCRSLAHAHGLCSAHFNRMRRYGSPTTGNPMGRRGPLPGTWHHSEEAKRKISRAKRNTQSTRADTRRELCELQSAS